MCKVEQYFSNWIGSVAQILKTINKTQYSSFKKTDFIIWLYKYLTNHFKYSMVIDITIKRDFRAGSSPHGVPSWFSIFIFVCFWIKQKHFWIIILVCFWIKQKHIKCIFFSRKSLKNISQVSALKWLRLHTHTVSQRYVSTTSTAVKCKCISIQVHQYICILEQ